MNQTDNTILLCVLALAVVFAVTWVISLLARLGPFLDELRYLNMELGRCSARMRPVWLRRKRRLWCSLLIPFYKYR